MREIGSSNFCIELGENLKCEIKEELRKREGKIIRQIGILNRKNGGFIYKR
jgi:hypothetical protein